MEIALKVTTTIYNFFTPEKMLSHKMLTYKVNDYITLRLEYGKTFIYVNGTFRSVMKGNFHRKMTYIEIIELIKNKSNGFSQLIELLENNLVNNKKCWCLEIEEILV